MGSYEIRWKHGAARDLRKPDKSVIVRIIAAVEGLAENPVPPDSRKLAGSERNYRVRVGDYRIIYAVDHAEKVVVIQHVRHRREAYR
jgi:mRNA interferase RelE/StbE